MKTGKSKPRTLPRHCSLCNTAYLAADPKSNYCYPCREPCLCACGCGLMAKSKIRPHLPGHASRMDTPQQVRGHRRQAQKISGDKNPSVTHRRAVIEGCLRYWASLTPAQKKDRTKNHLFVREPRGGRYSKKGGFRSVMEQRLAAMLDSLGVAYRYERTRRFRDGAKFYPDFEITVSGSQLLIEFSGYAYEGWRKQFDSKITKVVSSGYQVICVTYACNVTLMRGRISVPVYTIRGLRKWLLSLAPGELNLITHTAS